MKNYIFQPPSEVRVAMWLTSGQWNKGINCNIQLLEMLREKESDSVGRPIVGLPSFSA